MTKNILIYPGFVTDAWCSIEQRYLWLDEPLRKYFNVFWLVPPTGSKYTRCINEENRDKEPIYVTYLRKSNANIIVADITKFNFIKNYFLLKKILKTYKIDVVTQFFSPLGYYVELAAKLTGIKVIRKELNFTFHKKRKYKMIKWFFWKYSTDYYIPVSKPVEDHLKTKKLIKGNSYVVYNGLDIDKFPEPNSTKSKEDLINEFRLPTEVIFISCIARIDKSKQQFILLEMLYKLIDKQIVLLLVGSSHDKAYKESLLALIKKYGLEERVIFAGYRIDIPKIIDASEITYLPSSFEGLPNVIIESFIMYKPVIASDIPPIREIVDVGINGFCVKDNCIDEYCKRTLELLQDKEKRKEFGINGRRKVEKLFSKKTFIDESIRSFQKADRKSVV